LEDEDDIDTSDAKQFDSGLLARIKLFLSQHSNPNCLKEQMQHYDLKGEGVISQPSFRSTFLKLDVGLTLNEI